jgi:hypothetical protein
MLTTIKAENLNHGPNLDTPGLDVRFQAARQARRQLSSRAPDSKKHSGFDPNATLTPRLWRELSSALPGRSRKLL